MHIRDGPIFFNNYKPPALTGGMATFSPVRRLAERRSKTALITSAHLRIDNPIYTAFVQASHTHRHTHTHTEAHGNAIKTQTRTPLNYWSLVLSYFHLLYLPFQVLFFYFHLSFVILFFYCLPLPPYYFFFRISAISYNSHLKR